MEITRASERRVLLEPGGRPFKVAKSSNIPIYQVFFVDSPSNFYLNLPRNNSRSYSVKSIQEFKEPKNIAAFARRERPKTISKEIERARREAASRISRVSIKALDQSSSTLDISTQPGNVALGKNAKSAEAESASLFKPLDSKPKKVTFALDSTDSSNNTFKPAFSFGSESKTQSEPSKSPAADNSTQSTSGEGPVAGSNKPPAWPAQGGTSANSTAHNHDSSISPGFTFGAKSEATRPLFSFNSTSKASIPETGAGSSTNKPSTPKTNDTTAQPKFNFGSTTASTPGESQPDKIPSFNLPPAAAGNQFNAFGSGAGNESSLASGGGQLFGSSLDSTKGQSFSFNANQTSGPATPAFSFGSTPQPEKRELGNSAPTNPGQSFSFGASGSAFQFGANSQTGSANTSSNVANPLDNNPLASGLQEPRKYAPIRRRRR